MPSKDREAPAPFSRTSGAERDCADGVCTAPCRDSVAGLILLQGQPLVPQRCSKGCDTAAPVPTHCQRLAASGEKKQHGPSRSPLHHAPTQQPSSLGSPEGPAERVLSCLPAAQAATGGAPAPATLLHPVPAGGTALLPAQQNRLCRGCQGIPNPLAATARNRNAFLNFTYFLTIKLHHCLQKP